SLPSRIAAPEAMAGAWPSCRAAAIPLSGAPGGFSSELVRLGGFPQRQRGCGAPGNHLGDLIEVACPHLPLVPGRGVARLLRSELLLLPLGVGSPSTPLLIPGGLEHAGVERVEAGERHELELVAPCAELALETGDRRVVQMPLPVEAWRAIVHKQ